MLEEDPYTWEAEKDAYDLAAGSRHVRLPIDAVPERKILVFENLDTKPLPEVEQDLSLAQIKHILHCTLQGIADLHERNIFYGGMLIQSIFSIPC